MFSVVAIIGQKSGILIDIFALYSWLNKIIFETVYKYFIKYIFRMLGHSDE